jgi:predicted DNA-binding transcriptional regulator AlpA
MKTGILSQAQVLQRIPVSRTTLYRMVASGQFPPPVKLSSRQNSWAEPVVQAWLDEKFESQYAILKEKYK